MGWGIVAVLLMIVGLGIAGWFIWTHYRTNRSKSDEVSCTVTIGGVSDTYTVTTKPSTRPEHGIPTELKSEELLDSAWTTLVKPPFVEPIVTGTVPPSLRYCNQHYDRKHPNQFVALKKLDDKDWFMFRETRKRFGVVEYFTWILGYKDGDADDCADYLEFEEMGDLKAVFERRPEMEAGYRILANYIGDKRGDRV